MAQKGIFSLRSSLGFFFFLLGSLAALDEDVFLHFCLGNLY